MAETTYPKLFGQVTSDVTGSPNNQYASQSNVSKSSFFNDYLSSEEGAKAVADTNRRSHAMTADYASVGYDDDKYNELLSSGRGLSQMSDDEMSFIQSRYADSDISKRKAYTKSATDSYLAEMGMPSSKELNSYRQKYINYIGNGGVEQYPELFTRKGSHTYATEATSWIQEQWAKDNATGLGGETVTSKGKEIKYEDTYVDDQLKSIGLPPSSQLNEYYVKYQNAQAEKTAKQEHEDRVNGMYDKVMALEDKGMDRQKAWDTVLFSDEYNDLAKDYWVEPASMPDRADSKYKDDVDNEKFNKDFREASAANEKFENTDGRVSFDDYEKYYSRKVNEKRWNQISERYNQIQSNAQKAFSTPAVTAKEKEEQAKAITTYLNAFRIENADGTLKKFSDYEPLLALTNAGVPQDVIASAWMEGASALYSWNDTANAGDVRRWAATRALIDGATKDDGDYSANIDTLIQIKNTTASKGYKNDSRYDESLYDEQINPSMSTSRSTAVSTEGALYNAINGKEYGNIVGADENQREFFSDMTSTQYSDKPLISYMSEDERGAFNAKFKESPKKAMQFLESLQSILEKRQAVGMRSDVLFATSKEQAEESAYQMNLKSTEDELNSLVEGQTTYWHKEAWDRYSSYSDEALQRILEENSDENIQAVSKEDLHTAEDMWNVQSQVQYVLDERAEARADAQLASSFYGYTSADGQAATEQIKNDPNIAMHYGSTAMVVNGMQSPEGARSGMTNGEAVGYLLKHGWKENTEGNLVVEMTAEQKDRYNWLLLNAGAEQANKYYESIRTGLDVKASQKVAQGYDELAGKSKLGASLASVASMPFSGLAALGGSALNLLTGTEQSATQATQWDISGGLTEAVTKGITEDLGEGGMTDAINFLYNVGMSSANSAVGALLSSGVPFAGELALSASAYASTLRSGLQKGLSAEQATSTAVAAAVVEFVTEHMGIDHIFEGLKAVEKEATRGGKEYMIALLKQAGINFLPEALEEGVGNVINTAADMFINGDSAEIIENYNNAIAKGYSKEEAEKIAIGNFAKETALESLAGGLAGGGSVMVAGTATGLQRGIPNAILYGAYRYANGDDSLVLSGHTASYSKGKSVVENLFGKEYSDAVQAQLDVSETVGQKRNINLITEQFANIRNTDELYDYVYNDKGKVKLSKDEQVALAAALNGAGSEADLDSMEVAFVQLMAEKQTDRQMLANVNNDSIKSSQELREARTNLQQAREGIETAKANHQREIDAINTKLKDAQTRLAAATQKLTGDAKNDAVVNATISALNTEISNHQLTRDKINGDGFRALQASIKNSERQIASIQQALDRHYASYHNLLSSASSNRSVYAARYANSLIKVNEIGQQIDDMMSSEFADANDVSWLDAVQTQLADAESEAQYWQKRMEKSAPSTVKEAIQAAHSGRVKEYLASIEAQAETASATAQTASPAKAESSTESKAKPKNTASEDVKQDSATEEEADYELREDEKPPIEKPKKKTYNISKTVQDKFNRLAGKFGLKIVWQTWEEIGGNGRYDRITEPNVVYLATDMIADEKLHKDEVVARAFFSHEVVHYVATTQWYQRLSMLAEKYYKQLHKDKDVDGDDFYEFLIQKQKDQEKELHHRDFTREQAREELTAYFVQDVLFNGQSGNRNSLVWLTRVDGNATSNFLTAVEYLIKQGQVRRMKDGNPIRSLLLEAERTLALAIEERKLLNAKGLSSAFSNEKISEQKKTEQKTETKPEPKSETETAETPAEQEQTAEPVAEQQEENGKLIDPYKDFDYSIRRFIEENSALFKRNTNELLNKYENGEINEFQMQEAFERFVQDVFNGKSFYDNNGRSVTVTFNGDNMLFDDGTGEPKTFSFEDFFLTYEGMMWNAEPAVETASAEENATEDVSPAEEQTTAETTEQTDVAEAETANTEQTAETTEETVSTPTETETVAETAENVSPVEETATEETVETTPVEEESVAEEPTQESTQEEPVAEPQAEETPVAEESSVEEETTPRETISDIREIFNGNRNGQKRIRKSNRHTRRTDQSVGFETASETEAEQTTQEQPVEEKPLTAKEKLERVKSYEDFKKLTLDDLQEAFHSDEPSKPNRKIYTALYYADEAYTGEYMGYGFEDSDESPVVTDIVYKKEDAIHKNGNREAESRDTYKDIGYAGSYFGYYAWGGGYVFGKQTQQTHANWKRYASGMGLVQANITNSDKTKNDFVDNIINYGYLPETEVYGRRDFTGNTLQRGKLTKAEMFGREKNTLGSDIVFSQEQRQKLKDVVDVLAKRGGKVVLTLPTNTDFEANSLQALREIFSAIQPEAREDISFATAWNADTIDTVDFRHGRTQEFRTPKLIITTVEDANASKMIAEEGYTVVNLTGDIATNNEMYSNGTTINELSSEYSSLLDKYQSGDKSVEPQMQSLVEQAAKAAGYIPVTRYHQTKEQFTEFKTDSPSAGEYDSETPNGIFLKTNDHDIGIGGSVQMPLFISDGNYLHFKNRSEANAWYQKNIDGYSELQEEMKTALNQFEKKIEELEKQEFDPSKTDEEVDLLFEEEQKIIDSMRPVENEYRGRLRKILDDYFLNGNSEFDGIELDYDGHRWVNGKRENVHTFIAFSPSQVKSADTITYYDNGKPIPLNERFKADNPDIRYSVGTTIEDLSAGYNPNVSGMGATLSGDNVATTNAQEAIDKSAVLVNDNGDPVMNVINGGNGAMFSLGTFDAGGRDVLIEYLEKRKADGFLDQDQVDYIKKQMDRIHDFSEKFADEYVSFGNWSYAKVNKNINGSPAMSVIKKNAEYDMNIDFSLVCVKRRALNAVINKLVERGVMDDAIFDEEAVGRVNQRIRELNYETACKMCFVESARYKQAAFADRFVNRYNKLVKSLGGKADYFNFGGNTKLEAQEGLTRVADSGLNFTELDKILANYEKRKGKKLPTYDPNVALAGANMEEAMAYEIRYNPESRRLFRRGDFMSTNGFDALAMRSPSLMKVWNKKGQGGPKNSFSDMQYLNDIIYKGWDADSAYAVGGVRVQSFSDYVPTMFFDYVQMVSELAAGKLPAHAYTKELNFVKIFGLTGIKINMSLVPTVVDDGLAAGLKYLRDENGNIVMDENGDPVETYAWAEESFGYDRKKHEVDFDLLNRIQDDVNYGKNCGTIAIGVSDAHILKMMADPSIRMVIPYHRSNLPTIIAEMAHIEKFSDYQGVQHTRKKAYDSKKKKEVWKNLSVKEEYQFNEKLRELGDPKAVVADYLAWCEKNEYAPKFEADNKSAKFKNEEGYYKLLEDFTLYDSNGNYVPQESVQMRFAEKGEATLFSTEKKPVTDNDDFQKLVQYSLEDPRQTSIDSGAEHLTDEIEKLLTQIKAERKSKKMYSTGTTIEDLSSDYITDELQPRRTDYVYNDGDSYDEWKHNNKELLRPVYNDSRMKGINSEWYKFLLSRSTKDIHRISDEEASAIMYDNVKQSWYDGWFRAYDSDYKPILLQRMLSSPQVRNAGLSLAYENYLDIAENPMPFEEFLTTPIKLYRGDTGENAIDNDVFVAFTFDKKIADSFISKKQPNLFEIEVRPIDTYGSMRHLGEREIWVPTELVKQKIEETRNGIRYSLGTTIDDLIAEYGYKQQSARGKLNDIKTPKRTSKTTRVSDVAQTLKETPVEISNLAKKVVDDLIVETRQENGVPILNVGKEAGLVYRPMTMEEMDEMGEEYVTRSGSLDQAMRDLARDIPNTTVGDLTRIEAAAMKVFADLAVTDNFDPRAYGEFISAIGILNSTWGRMGKAMQLLNASPLGRRKYMEKVVERLNAENAKAMSRGVDKLFHKNGVKQIEIEESLYLDLQNATTPEEVRKAEFRISEEIGKQSPLSVASALRNWRYFAMLANPVTHERNMLGNMAMYGMRSAKDVVASGIESAMVRTGLMDAEDRTHNINFNVDKEIGDYAVALFIENAENVQGNDKYGVRDKMRDAIKKSPVKFVDRLMRFNGNMLEKEDAVFLRLTYVSAAKQYIVQRGFDVNDMTARQKAEVHQYAKQQAQEATYRDASALADTLNMLARRGGLWQFFVESTVPFKKTPVNITKRGLEYSPLGLIKGVIDLATYAKKHSNGTDYRISASKIADELGKGIVGSALSLIGFFLAKAGILKLKAGYDDRDESYEKDLGHQDYSLEIGNMSIKIESLVPMTFPLFAGAAVLDALSDDEKKNFIPAMGEAMLTIADPLMDMSFMSSLDSVLNSYNKNKLLGIVENMAASYVGQFFPTVTGRLNSTWTPTRRTTKSAQSAKEGIGTQADYRWRSYVSKIPFANLFLQPYVKTTGEYDKKMNAGDYALAIIDNFLSPVNIQIIDSEPVKAEMSRLVATTGNTDFIPKNPAKYFTVSGQSYNLTASEYTEYSKDHNESVYAVLTDVINSEEYRNAETDDDRVEMLSDAYDSTHKAMLKKWKAIIVDKHSKQ